MAGKLIYLIGASGAGKDTLLKSFRQKTERKDTVVAHRYVARNTQADAQLFQNQISLTFKEFADRSQKGLFAMQWHAHDSSYGIGLEINLWLESGMNVIVNGSREYVPEMLKSYPDALVFAVVVDNEVLAKRLAGRNRETEQEIKERIQRNSRLEKKLPDSCQLIDSSGEQQETLDQLEILLEKYAH